MVFTYDTRLKEIIGSFYVEYVDVIPEEYTPHHEGFVDTDSGLLGIQKIHDLLETNGERYFYWFDSEAPDYMKPYLKFTYGKWAMLPDM